MAFWDPIVDEFRSIAGGVRDFVTSMIGAAVDWISSWLNGVVTWVQGWITWIADNVPRLWDKVWAVASDVASAIAQAFNYLPGLVVSWVDYLGRRIVDAVQHARDLFDNAIGYARDAIGAVYDWVDRNVAGPLSHAIDGVYRWVNDNVLNRITGWIGEAVGPVRDLVNNVRSAFDLVADTVRRIKDDVVPVVMGAWHFLVFVAEHPLTWWTDYARQLLGFDREWWTRHLEHDGSAVFQSIMNALERWIG